MGVDDLLLGLTHHWSRDRSVFPTEDDRLNLSAIMLFQAYTAYRPAELVDGTKYRAGRDPMIDDPEVEDAIPVKSSSTNRLYYTEGPKGDASIRVTRSRVAPTAPPGRRWEEDDSNSDTECESAIPTQLTAATIIQAIPNIAKLVRVMTNPLAMI